MIKLKIAIIGLIIIGTQQVFSQVSVRGTVTDDSGVPLPGVSVLVKGTTNGASTDFDGMYTLNNVKTTDVLVFTYLGMTTQEIVVESKSTIDVSMESSAESLDEIIVVGYGTQSRVDVTGAISTVELTDLNEIPPVTNAESALQGRAAGLTIANAGVPGSTPSVQIRGLSTLSANTPLFVIDGVITGNLSGLNPSDIASISVLKDASTTAVYGAQGSNGVIVVTTKKGKKGVGTLSFNTYTGVQSIAKRYDVLETVDYLNYVSEYGVFPNRPVETFRTNTDWQDEIFRTAFIQDYNVSYSGGGETGNYLFSGGYQKQEGVIIETGFERYSFRGSGSKTFGKLKVGQTMSIAFSKQRPERQGGGRTLIEHAIKAAPYLSVFNPNNLGGFQGPSSSADGQDAENPVRVQTHGDAINRSLGIIGNIYGEYEFLPGLSFRSQVSLDYFQFNNRSFIPSYDDDSVPGSTTHARNFAEIGRFTQQGQTIMFTNSLKYKTTINNYHDIEVLALAEKFESKSENFGAGSRNLVTDEVDQIVDNEFLVAGSGSGETNKLGFMTRINYDYDNRYIFSASYRRDASSRFGENKRWGNFYSASAGWNIAREKFMENTAFSTLKLRGSYGTTGSDNIGDYRFAPALTGGFQYPFDNVVGVGVTQEGNENPDLQWETKKILNVGFDLGIFNEKFTTTFEYFKNNSEDLLINIPTPLSNGNQNNGQAVNLGESEVKGFEITLGYNDREGAFTWSANLNLSHSKAKMISIAGQDEIPFYGFGIRGGGIGGNISRVTEGDPLFYFYGLESNGIYSNQAEVDADGFAGVQPGDVRYVDQNNDGVINADDRVDIGNPYPDLIAGLSIDANYKNFDFGILVSGFYGNEIFNTNLVDLNGGTRRPFNVSQDYFDNRWTPTNTNGTEPRVNGAEQNYVISDRYVEDGSFTRIRNVTLGYTIPNDIFNEYFSKLRIYLSGQNVYTFTNYSGLDPELRLDGDQGIDRGAYPQPRSFLLGLQVSF
ncbi:TonB-dependent receptor [Aquimarina sp. D1M17]|uniref:SusC/RagA family TonB-linked outer membrane protein n=1 Tax=Aquimarina acroporae TaxID=2937283 RepID=UPI0020C14CC6|nr:TonB-dependent receptor [Aquimarina acroporae]MCK8521765.1 TonB-dependent receptor [Aquimarina acroporae]